MLENCKIYLNILPTCSSRILACTYRTVVQKLLVCNDIHQNDRRTEYCSRPYHSHKACIRYPIQIRNDRHYSDRISLRQHWDDSCRIQCNCYTLQFPFYRKCNLNEGNVMFSNLFLYMWSYFDNPSVLRRLRRSQEHIGCMQYQLYYSCTRCIRQSSNRMRSNRLCQYCRCIRMVCRIPLQLLDDQSIQMHSFDNAGLYILHGRYSIFGIHRRICRSW